MKAEFLKLAKVKTEKAFYKKYPTEEAFFKAHPEAKKSIKKAQTGIDVNGNGIPDEQENTSPQNIIQNFGIGAQTMGRMNTTVNTTTVAPIVTGQFNEGGFGMFKNNNAVPLSTSSVNTNYSGYEGEVNPSSKSFADKAAPYISAAGDVFKGISSLKAQGDEKDRMRQMRKITDLYKVASGTREEEPERRYNTPWDNFIQPDQMFPTYGVGTNVLARDGAEIQNTYAPGYLYDDLGYEPLNDSEQVKQYYHGGKIYTAQNGGGFMKFMEDQGVGQTLGMLTGALSNNSGESQIGQGIGAAAGTAFGGPVGGMIGGAIGNLAGGLLNTSQKSIKRDRRAIQRNMDTIMGNQFGQSFQNQYSGYVENGGDIPNYENGGYMNPEYNPQVIAEFGGLDEQDFYNYAHQGMDSLRSGGHLRGEYTPISNRGMQQYAMGGELKTHWGGYAETMSQNPYLPGNGETVMFRGKSHDESDGYGNTGIGITYGNSPVEVERGEPAVKLKDGSSGEENLTVYGNLKIPNEYIPLLGDEKAKGKKFKNYVAEISKDEARQNKLIEKSTTLLDDLDVKNSFDKLKFEALSANIKGANMKLKSIADKKINAANLQNAINDTAEEFGLDADALARGRGKFSKETLQEYAEYGKSIPTAQRGISDVSAAATKKRTTTRNTPVSLEDSEMVRGRGEKWDYTQIGPQQTNPDWQSKDAYYKNWVTKVDNAFKDETRAKKILDYIKTYTGPNAEKVKAALGKFPTEKAQLEYLRKHAADEQISDMHYLMDAGIQSTEPAKTTTPVEAKKEEPKKEEDKRYATTPYKRSAVMDIANQLLPFIRPTDQEPLDPNQLTGEMYALSNNQLEPVQAQGYRPDLGTPYDISLQDQLNANQADFNSMQRMAGYNPAAQATLAAQKYSANSGVLGEQFRMNQAMQSGVYDKNRDILNDAKLKNLSIFDQQYGRQAQAKSNTKAITQAALSSISDKYAKNNLENRTLGIYENMYNYRFDPAGRAINMNPLYQPNMPTVYGKQTDPNYIPVKDAQGNIIEYVSTTPTESKTASVASGFPATPVASTTYSLNQDYVPFEETQEEIYEDVAPKRKGGSINKNYSQSSIVRAFK